jgi:spore germination protein GerM
MDVFFVHYDAALHHSMLVAAHRTTVSGGTEARLAVALHALLAGPTPQEKRRGLTSEIPLGTTLRSVQVRGGVATVDLTTSFTRGGGSSSMMGRVWQVVYTATQFPDTSAAQILLDGERVQTLGGEGVMIGEPLTRGASLPTF